MPRRTKDEAEQTRHAILDAAEKLFHARGVSRTSLDHIAAAAAVTRGAIYWHFQDKFEICEALMRRIFLPHEDMLEQLAAKNSATPLQDLEKACLHALKMMAQDKRRRDVVAIFTLRCEYGAEMHKVSARRNACKNRMLKLSERFFKRAKQHHQLAAAWTPRRAAIALQALLSGLISGALEQRANFHFATTCPACVRAFFRSLRA